MNTQIQKGLAEIANPPASDWQVRAEGEGNFGPPALCRHPSNHTEAEKNISSDKCSAGSEQTAQPQKERVTMNTQIQRGLVEIARPPASECQVRTEGEADFVPPALCRHLSNHPEVGKSIGSDKCSAGSAQTAQPQKERVTMNTQIQRGLVEIAKPPASEWQVRAKGEGDFGPPALCHHPSNHTEVEKAPARTSAQQEPRRLHNHRRCRCR